MWQQMQQGDDSQAPNLVEKSSGLTWEGWTPSTCPALMKKPKQCTLQVKSGLWGGNRCRQPGKAMPSRAGHWGGECKEEEQTVSARDPARTGLGWGIQPAEEKSASWDFALLFCSLPHFSFPFCLIYSFSLPLA